MATPHWFQKQLLLWYQKHGRHDLPWKSPLSPYRVWIAEIMLQQTQVATVIAYFNRFMRTFPTLDILAKAPLDKILAHWAGLGYYARARNVHKTAQLISKQKQFPNQLAKLMALPGIGRSTAGAILSQGFNLRAPILDGNVRRVLCRFHKIEGWPGQKTIQDSLWQLAERYTPQKRVADYTQAIMDLGATCCTRAAPKCQSCPLQKNCQAYHFKVTHLYPKPKPKVALATRHLYLLCIFNKKKILLKKRPLKGIWGGLFSLPEFSSLKAAKDFADTFMPQPLWQKHPPVKHSLTHFHLMLEPLVIHLSQPCSLKDQIWASQSTLKTLGLPAPIKKLLANLFSVL